MNRIVRSSRAAWWNQIEDGALDEDTEFSFTWECTLSDGSTVPEGGPGTVLLTGGEVWVSEEIEAEAQCAVEETEPEPSQPGALPETGTFAGWPAATAAVALLLIGVSLLIFNQRRDRSRTN
ncbi:hypothetical protein HGQ17_02155 [Nesterenkonia sp. MY13]|uniref:DUF5979 domain-containing protein n=1 Tax=Nesterenkonia sedimenti TaxID=1463632 RepID=A0A7X8THI0_9MICC|nr:hypothetical protein [Nesterenkonia sedimenti]